VNVTKKHFQLNISDPALTIPFYKKLLTYFGYTIIHETDTLLGMGSGVDSFWLMKVGETYLGQHLDRDSVGLNHFAFHVENKADVDKFKVEFMEPNGIKAEFDTPRDRPEFGVYYQVMFLDPEGLALEVVFSEF
jgi:catechol 2,3-dioxygenase-like lactoylglutathione lyase family enzyme